MTQERLHDIQATLKTLAIPAWLLYSFRDSNPISVRALGLAPEVHQSRRWALLIPAEGEPRGLVHRIEPHIGSLMPGGVDTYSSHAEFERGLARILEGIERVAMEYSPRNAIPVVAKVDAGTVELVRQNGVEVISSGPLLAHLEARLDTDQLASALRAGRAVREIMLDAFSFIGDSVRRGATITEYDVQRRIVAEIERRGMVTDHAPICGVNANSANPHYEPTAERSDVIAAGDFVLLDLWARESAPGSVFGDITWVGFVGTEIPERHARIFAIVRDARDAVLERVRRAFAETAPLTGAECDDAARDLIRAAGYGDAFVHRTGHSITSELHGAGANLDNFESEDTRPIIAGTSFSIEPGIYLPGEFGVRSELDVVVDTDGTVHVPSEPLQHEVIAILQER